MPKEPFKAFIERTTPIGKLARLYREKQLKKKYLTWQQTGGKGPMPNYGKQRVVKEYLKKFGLKTFIETGTYKGKMVYAVLPYVDTIYSIELDPVYCRKAQDKFAGYSNIHIIQGQSGDVLPELMANINEPCLFWLDAHYSGGSTAKGPQDTPIMQELKCLLNHAQADKHVFLIDDARCFVGKDDYPTIEKLREYILAQKTNWHFEVENDIIKTHASRGII